LAGTHPVASSLAPLPAAGSGVAKGTIGQDPLGPNASQPAAPWTGAPARPNTSVLTSDMTRDVLMSMGKAPTSSNIAIAQSMAKLGLPLTVAALTEAHAALTAAVGSLPASFALAKALGLPPSPGVLRGLTTVMTVAAAGSPAQTSAFSLLENVLPPVLTSAAAAPLEAVVGTAAVTEHPNLPLELLQRIGLTIDFNAIPLEIAAKMRNYSLQILRSTENQIAEAMQANQPVGDIADARVILLQLAADSPDAAIRDGAAALASHFEGQQLINVGTARTSLTAPLIPPAYIALPFAMMGEQSLVELRLWPRDEWQGGNANEDTDPIKATIRLTLAGMGRIQADITGRTTGQLRCCLSAEQPAVSTLLTLNARLLSDQLARAGWLQNEVTCRASTDWGPLWTGGDELSKPRKRVDWQA
jgi:hypothetical protein